MVLNNILPVPRLADDAIEFLEAFFQEHIGQHPRVLEFGMGGSTLWFAARTNNLISLEHDSFWYSYIKTCLKDKLIDLRCCPLPLHLVCVEFPDNFFDLILIDNEDFDEGRMRIRCLEASLPLLKSGGIIMFDNADRPKFRPIYEIMKDKGWRMWIATQTSQKEGYNAGSQTVWWLKA